MRIESRVPLAQPRRPAQSSKAAPALPKDAFVASPKKVWLVHGSYTGGHASAARSLQEALKEYPGVTTEIINTADTSGMPVSTAAEKALSGGKWIRSARNWLFEQQFEGNRLLNWATDGLYKVAGHFNEGFIDRVEKEKPDLIISTQGSTNSLLNGLAESNRLKVPVHTVVTDFGSHQVWAQDNIERYYVALPQTAEDLKKHGVDDDKITVSGIPIKAKFGKSATPEEAQPHTDLGLDPEKKTVLMMGGSLGLGGFSDTIAALDDLQGDFQMAVIAGKNEQAKAELEALSPKHDLKVEGFVGNIEQWMRASDVVITRPGGLTCSELLAEGTPTILTDVKAGLGARNVSRLVEAGAAMKAGSPEEAAEKVDKILNDPKVGERMRQAALQYGRPDAAAQIAAEALGSLRASA